MSPICERTCSPLVHQSYWILYNPTRNWMSMLVLKNWQLELRRVPLLCTTFRPRLGGKYWRATPRLHRQLHFLAMERQLSLAQSRRAASGSGSQILAFLECLWVGAVCGVRSLAPPVVVVVAEGDLVIQEVCRRCLLNNQADRLILHCKNTLSLVIARSILNGFVSACI